jgi:hypothetical protein
MKTPIKCKMTKKKFCNHEWLQQRVSKIPENILIKFDVNCCLPKVDNFLTSSFTNSDLQPGGKGTRKPRM